MLLSGEQGMIDTIIFDAEGVVVDTEALWDKSQEIFLRHRGISYDREELKPLMAGRDLVEGVEIMKQYYGFTGDKHILAKERLDSVQPLFASEVQFMDGFLLFFEQVQQKGFNYCIATSLSKSLMLTIDRRLNLIKMFNGKIFFVSDVEGNRSKPDPAVFYYAVRKLNSSPDKCLVLEDSINGIVGAKKAGMRCVGITTTFTKEQLKMADRVVEHFSEIPLESIDSWI
jgi:HAD superfamily hydrolase (TIGR01509 family)